MPYLYTGKLGASGSQPGRIVPGRSRGRLGIRLAALLKTIGKAGAFLAEALIYASTQVRTITASSIIVPTNGLIFSTSTDTTNGFVAVDVFQAITPVVTQELYRWNPVTQEYVLVYSSPQATFAYVDFAAPLNVSFWYRVIGYDSSGVQVGSPTDSGTITLNIDDWYLVRSSDPTENVRIDTTSSTAQKNRQSESFQPLGRLYKTVQQGDVLGSTGTVEIVLPRDSRALIERALRRLAAYPGQVYLKSPFGDVLPVDISQMSTTMLPGGHLQVSIPYTENDIG